MPWTRLHGIKDYYGMAWLAGEHPEVHLTFNLVPSLLVQLEDYAQGGAQDEWLRLTAKRAADLEPAEAQFVLSEFFSANWDTMVRPHPRYHELLLKRRFGRRTPAQAAAEFSRQDMLDLQVWATLAWFFPQLLRSDAVLAGLAQKGRGFSEDDKAAMLAKQREVLAAIIPMYRELQERGTAELSVSPYYHPILPLLCKMERAREAMPKVPMPHCVADFGDDARTQVVRAVESYRAHFGRAPRGMWPSEGSVSPEVPLLAAEAGIRWLATDEGILSRSLGCTLHRDERGVVQEWETLYKPYRIDLSSADCGLRIADCGLKSEIANPKSEIRNEVAMVFRDRALSDLIGFHYYHRQAEDAAEDFAQRLLAIGAATGSRDAFVAVILDGENAWEFYQDSGMPFLHALYRRLGSLPGVATTTVSEYLDSHPPTATVPRLFSGSWINSDFAVWIGHDEDRRAWELLAKTRQFLASRPQGAPGTAQAWEELFVAEGSDWFWWYGDDRSSAQDAEFDRLFRLHLKNVYELVGERPPDVLDEPVSQPRVAPYTQPTAFMWPKVDGRRGGYFDWSCAGLYRRGRDTGAIAKDAPDLIQAVQFGFNDQELFLRVDFLNEALAKQPDSARLAFVFSEPREVQLEVSSLKASPPRLRIGGQESPGGRAAAVELVEAACPFNDLGFRPRQTARFHVKLFHGDTLVERAPRAGNIAFEVPTPDFEREMWQV